MLRVEFSSRARNDLTSINHYIAKDNPAAARKLIARTEAVCALLAQFPTMGHTHHDIRSPGYLCHYVGNYLIVYRHTVSILYIVRIVHGNRNIRSLF